MVDSSTKPLMIGIIGNRYNDLLTYLATCIGASGRKILVIDCSDGYQLQSYFQVSNPKEPGLTSDVVFGPYVDYAFGFGSAESHTEDYQVVIQAYGASLTHLNAYVMSHWCFAITNSEKRCLQSLVNQMNFIDQFLEQPRHLITVYKDLVPCKIDEKYLNHVLTLPKEPNLMAQYAFDFDMANYKTDLLNTYNQSFEFKEVSKAYQEFVEDIMTEVLGCQKSEIRKAKRKARRGR